MLGNDWRLSVHFCTSLAAMLALTLACSGCGETASETAQPADGAQISEDGHDDHEHDGHSHAGEGEVATAMAKLSPEDREIAESLKVCVVSGEELGSMGTPIKVEHDGQAAFLCCEGCRESFEADPEKFLAGLKSDGDSTSGDADAPSAEGGEPESAADASEDT